MGWKDLFSKKKPEPAADTQPVTGQFPTYEDAVDDDIFVQSAAAARIEREEKDDWEYLLFAESLTDNLNILRQFKKQNRENPFVRAIGNDSEGSSYLQFTNNLIGTLSIALERATSKIAMCGDQFEEAIGAPGESGDADAIKEVAMRFMDPYISFLAAYNDICTIREPEGLEKLHAGEKRVFEDLLSSFERYYEDLAGGLKKWLADPDAGYTPARLDCDLKSAGEVTKELQRVNAANPELLQSAKIHRIAF